MLGVLLLAPEGEPTGEVAMSLKLTAATTLTVAVLTLAGCEQDAAHPGEIPSPAPTTTAPAAAEPFGKTEH
jgi:hypothetical protein